MYFPAVNISIQYSASEASFRAIEYFDIKSFFDCAFIASLIFAPILVPDRNNCFDKTYSLLFSHNHLYAFTMRIAKLKDFSYVILVFAVHPRSLVSGELKVESGELM